MQALRLPNEDDVTEVMQESFLRLLRYRHCGPDSLKYLLFRVAMNLAVTHQRQAGVRHAMSLEDCELVSDDLPADQRLVREEEMTQVVMAIQSLPPRCRQMYVMSRLRGFRQREIAQHCGISQRMVELHIARAQTLIRERCARIEGSDVGVVSGLTAFDAEAAPHPGLLPACGEKEVRDIGLKYFRGAFSPRALRRGKEDGGCFVGRSQARSAEPTLLLG